jgi:septum formation protein
MLPHLAIHDLVLGSASPRRQALLKEAGFEFDTITANIEEHFSEDLKAQEIPLFLSKLKADHLIKSLGVNKILITADTIVWVNGHVLNKPSTLLEAKEMLKTLSSNLHTVYTGVCVKSNNKTMVFSESTNVYFNSLSDEMIDYYLENYSPLDKAGAYGIQEFIGYVGIQKIEGCYYNVMGFPVSRFIHELQAMQ